MNRRGLSTIEVLLSVTLLAVLFAVSLQSGTLLQNALSARGARQVEQFLLTAAQRARDGLSGTSWGLYLNYNQATRLPTQAVVFSGTSYATRDTTQDLTYPLSQSGLKFTTVSLSGSAASSGNDHEVVFGYLTGATTQYGFITVDSFGSSTEIDVPAIGIPTRP